MIEHLQAVVFDMDGVIAETEGDGHRVAFNQTFKEMGINAEWDYDTYGELLKISGGKERMRHYFKEWDLPDGGDRDGFIAQLHKKKTENFQKLIQSGDIPPRLGIPEFVKSILDANLKIALATTSNENAAHTLLSTLLGQDVHDRFDEILAGDVVSKKKPDPEIYNLAKERLHIDPAKSFVIEDTENGLRSALAAGFQVCVTTSQYTKHENFEGAAFVVNSIKEGAITIEKLDEYLKQSI